jgi:exonuclease III
MVSWNVNSFTWRRNASKIALLASLPWDVALLQECSAATYRELRSALAVDGVCALDLHRDTVHDVPIGAAILSRVGVLTDAQVLESLPLPERFLAATVKIEGNPVRVASWHAPNAAGDGVGRKMAAYEQLTRWANSAATAGATVLGADTNSWETGWEHAPATPDDPFRAEHAFLREPAQHGMRDAFRAVLAADPVRLAALLARRPGSALATTYLRGSRNQPVAERMDRVLVSEHLAVDEVEHLLADGLAAGSDHALVSVRLHHTDGRGEAFFPGRSEVPVS